MVLSIIMFSTNSYAYDDYYVIRHIDNNRNKHYYLNDNNNNHNDDYDSYLGFTSRFGYTFSDNGYFTYGLSMYYNFNQSIGITAGFDGYYGSIYLESNNTIYRYDGVYSKFPMWDVRFGFVLGKYFSLGAIYGQCNVCDPNVVVHQKYINNCTVYNKSNYCNYFGGFITFLCPVSTHFGVDVDLAYTVHTGFSISGGLIFRIPVK